MLIRTPIFLKRNLNATPERIDSFYPSTSPPGRSGFRTSHFTSRPADQPVRSSAWIAALNVLDEFNRHRQPLEVVWREGNQGVRGLSKISNQNRDRWRNQTTGLIPGSGILPFLGWDVSISINNPPFGRIFVLGFRGSWSMSAPCCVSWHSTSSICMIRFRGEHLENKKVFPKRLVWLMSDVKTS